MTANPISACLALLAKNRSLVAREPLRRSSRALPEMLEDYHRRIFNRGDDLQGAAAVEAVFDVDVEDPFKKPGPAHITVITSNTSGRAKKAHAFARVEDVALCPSQDFGLAVIHGTSQANPI
jgi:hypothetical protein